jgi:transglutaminase-like putative cysteine protease
MIPAWQLNRTGLFWLLIGYGAVVALHFSHLPAWIPGLAAIVMLWRIQIYRSRWQLPGKLIRFGLAFLCVVGLFSEYRTLVGLDPMVALLLVSYSLKLLEMRHRKDCYLVIFIACFLAVTQALFDQTPLSAVYIVGTLMVLIAALAGQHSELSEDHVGRPLKTATVLLLQALPLMLLMFVVMPRVGALWSVPLNTSVAKTGVSGTLSPGDITQLGRSAEPAFRATFSGDIPPQHQLYWRGLVLSRFDGREWRSAGPEGFQDHRLLRGYGSAPAAWEKSIVRQGQSVSYDVYLEATQQPWLFALSTPVPRSEGVLLARDFRLVYRQPVAAKIRYQVESWLDYQLSPDRLSQSRRAVELQIPPRYNPKTVDLARRWRLEGLTDKALMGRVLGLYNREFVYTLEPPALGQHSVDEFLFSSKSGFCEHFASSFVFFMRAAGVPARVVVGYQGGEIHPDGYVLVRQYDAHAWAEVWFAGEGWVRVDPTAAVAPERIESSLAEVLGNDEGFLADSPLSLVRFRHISWLNSLRLQLDSLNYAWARWVLGFDAEQSTLLDRWLGGSSPVKIGLTVLIAGLVVLAALAWMQLRGVRVTLRDELDEVYALFCQKLAKIGIVRHTGEAPGSFAQRAVQSRPDLAREIAAITRHYQHMRYGDESWQQLVLLRKAVKRFNPTKTARSSVTAENTAKINSVH